MASTYALPVAAMPHGHNHIHSHSHSHSPSFSSSMLGPGGQRPTHGSRTIRQERSTGNLHAHSQSESPYNHGHSHTHNHDRHQSNPNLAAHLYNSSLNQGAGHSEKVAHDPAEPYLDSNGREPSLRMGNPLLDDRFGPGFVANDSRPHSDQPHSHHNSLHHNHNNPHNEHLHHYQGIESAGNGTALNHGHSHSKTETRSRFTSMVLPYTENWPLLHSIMKEKDSRRIFYFMSLNFAFMTVQAFYGFVTDSLGLLSDSIHMFFDCLALAMGLFAAVSSKWPASERFPYGFGKIESLSGFGNGVFLMLISIEIMIEAVERLAEGQETKRLTELLIVSSLGLAVNLVGMAAFGHHHHGHDHSHGGHDHDHDHSHSHSHSHSHEHGSSHDHSCTHDRHDHHDQAEASPKHSHAHSDHSHDNENMRGIFLHVLADTMGSAAVIVSTLLIQYIGWSGWDPLASCIIAILIFLSSIPLVSSSAKKLLLTVPDDTEYQLRNTLAGVSDLRGVASYTVPRFWMADKVEKEGEEVLGVMHIIATRGSDLDDVRERTRAYLSSKGMNVVLQVEKDGDTRCWCGGTNRSPSTSRFS